jgi:transposase InsO family protein
LAQFALVYARGWAGSGGPRLAAHADQLEQEIALLREEICIKDARLARIAANRRPHYLPRERLAILELRAARGWSLAQTSSVFQVTANTIASWTSRLDEQGPDALLRTPEPVNKFPDFVRYVVQRLQTLCPRLGKVKIAQLLARAGLHLAATTVGRLRRQPPAPPPSPPLPPPAEPMASARRVTAKHPNHVWHVDLTTLPTRAGSWTSWLPFAAPLCWPFGWWLAVVVDHYSRRIHGLALFKRQPTSQQVRQFLGRVIAGVGAVPKHLVTDSGMQFTCVAFQAWCQRRSIHQRQGAIGKHGSIAVIERAIRTLKNEGVRRLACVPLLRRSLWRELQLFVLWFNSDRPHTTLTGATPDEVYLGRRPACRAPRFEPRAAWPRGSPCARPQVLVKGRPGVLLHLSVDFVGHRRHLPHVTLQRVA